ncbi:MAG: ribosome maturation factor RimM [Actinobacteria bacterium]|nr:ribosome maturation factor RimM [Actinomycetota bacterium]
MQLVVARIGRAHGVLGEATVEVRTDQPEDRFFIGSVLATEPESFGPLTISSVRDHNGTLLLGFEGVSDRNEIEKLRNVLLLADVDIEADSTEDDFHVQQLLQCEVSTEDGAVIGKVTDVINLPGQDVLAVSYNDREVLIPFVKAIVPTVDIKNRKIVIVPPLGLLDE